jgi:hypothetical protein
LAAGLAAGFAAAALATGLAAGFAAAVLATGLAGALAATALLAGFFTGLAATAFAGVRAPSTLVTASFTRPTPWASFRLSWASFLSWEI